MSSKTTEDVVVLIYNASANAPASLLSLTPSLNFFFLFKGKTSCRWATSASGALPDIEEFIIYNAALEESKGRKD